MSYPINSIPDGSPLRILGKIDNRQDGLSCNGCSNAQLIAIFAAELPKLEALLSRPANLGATYQIGNESNCCPYLTPQQWVMQYTLYRTAILGLDPTAKITSPPVLYYGSSIDGTDYLNSVLDLLPSSQWPAVYAVHFYAGNQTQTFKNALAARGLGAASVIVTEFGNSGIGTMDQMVAAFEAQGFAQWFWFEGSYEPQYPETALTQNGTLTAVGVEYQRLATQ